MIYCSCGAWKDADALRLDEVDKRNESWRTRRHLEDRDRQRKEMWPVRRTRKAHPHDTGFAIVMRYPEGYSSEYVDETGLERIIGRRRLWNGCDHASGRTWNPVIYAPYRRALATRGDIARQYALLLQMFLSLLPSLPSTLWKRR